MQNRSEIPLSTNNLPYQIVSNTLTSIGSHLYHFSSSSIRVMTYPLSAMKEYIFGDVVTYLLDSAKYHRKLIDKARQNKETGLAVANFGLFVGHLAIWVPRNPEDLKYVVNKLDEEKNGRQIYHSLAFLSGSKKFFLSDTTSEAMTQRKILTKHLTPARYDSKLICKEVDEAMINDEPSTVDLRKVFGNVVFNVLAKRIFGVESLPKNTVEVIESFDTDTTKIISFPFPRLFKFSPALRKKRSFYEKFEESFLHEQLTFVLKDLEEKEIPQNKNMILSFLIYLIQKDHPHFNTEELTHYLHNMSKEEVEKYFKTESMKMLPILLKPAITLIDILVVGLSQLAKNPEIIKNLRIEMEKTNLFENNEEITNQMLSKLTFLNAIYEETLRFDSTKVIPRFSKDVIKHGTVHLPPRTTIVVDYEGVLQSNQFGENLDKFDPTRFLSSEKDEEKKVTPTLGKFPFIPFSTGKRACPGMSITPRIYKITLAYIIHQFDVEITSQKDHMTFTPRHLASLDINYKLKPSPINGRGDSG